MGGRLLNAGCRAIRNRLALHALAHRVKRGAGTMPQTWEDQRRDDARSLRVGIGAAHSGSFWDTVVTMEAAHDGTENRKR